MSRILIVEDEPSILMGLADAFRREGHEVLTEAAGDCGYETAKREQPDVLVLDLMLPGMNGYEVCRKLRADGRMTPIVMLTARGEESDRVLGLDLGADDYVTKPFSLRELLARVRALLRRSQPHEGQARLVVDDIVIDFEAYEASRAGEPLEMTRREFDVLKVLTSKPARVWSRDELLDVVVGKDVFVSSRTIDNHIVALRAKLEIDPAEPRRLITVRGVGYKWCA